MSKKPVEGDLPSPHSTELEDILDQKEFLIKFRHYLASIYSLENFDFWLEAETFRHLTDANVLASRAKEIFEKYFSKESETPVNIDDASQEEELKKRLKAPTRETFVTVQNIAWGLLKFECFPRFKLSPQWAAPLQKKQKDAFKKSKVATHLDELVKLVKKIKKSGNEFHVGAPAPVKTEPKLEPRSINNPPEEKLYDLPDIEEIFDDEELMLAFREFLYRQIANENLAFWIEAELYRHTEDTEKRKARAQEMYTKFCTSESPQALNIEGSLRNTINKGIESVSIAAFREAQKMTWKVLKNEWFPEFCASELFQECNEEAVEYKKSSITRERGNTIYWYDKLVALKETIEKEGRDFAKEITEELDEKGHMTPRKIVTPLEIPSKKEKHRSKERIAQEENEPEVDELPKSSARKSKSPRIDKGEVDADKKKDKSPRIKEKSPRLKDKEHDKDKEKEKEKKRDKTSKRHAE